MRTYCQGLDAAGVIAAARSIQGSAGVFTGADTALGPTYFADGHAFETSLRAIYVYLWKFY